MLALLLGPSVVLVAMAPVAASTTTGRRASVARAAAGKELDPREFEPGACVEYPPTSGSRKLTVFLDAGHGGLDPGGVGTTESGQVVYEADATLPVELDAMKCSGPRGSPSSSPAPATRRCASPGLVTSRAASTPRKGCTTTWRRRDACADTAKANVLVGIYFDAGGSSYDAGSVTGYDTARAFSAENLRLATLVQNDVLGAMNAQGWAIPDLGVVDDNQLGGPPLTTAAADYGHLLLLGPAEPGWFSTPSTMPGALIEPLFITDPFEASIATSAQGQQLIAGGLAQAVEQYFARTPDTGQNSEAATPHRHGRTTGRG